MRILGQFPREEAAAALDRAFAAKEGKQLPSLFEPDPPPRPKAIPKATRHPVVPHGTTTFLEMGGDAYHADPCERPSLSASIAGVLDRQSPAHAFELHPRLGGKRREPTKAMDTGTILHAFLLGTERTLWPCHYDDWRTREARDERDEARSQGLTPILQKDYDEAKAKAEILRTRFVDQGIVLDGASEVAAFWTETAGGGEIVQCRGMIDHFGAESASVIDLKSCRSAHPDACQRHIEAYGYDIQCAAYTSAVEKIMAGAAGRVRFTFVFFEPEPPYIVLPVRLSEAYQELGRRKWWRAVEAWARCLKEDRWPGYATETIEMSPPKWAMANELQREERESW